MKLRFGLILTTCLIASCADGRSLLVVTVTSQNLMGIDHLHFEFTDSAGRMSQPIDSPLADQNGALPPDFVEPFGFPKQVHGRVSVKVSAIAADGALLDSKTIDVEIKPSAKTSASVELAANGPPIDLAGADFSKPDLIGADLSTTDLLNLDSAQDDGSVSSDMVSVPHVGKLAFTTQPAPSVAVGALLAPAVVVTVTDDDGNVLTGASNTISVSLEAGTSAAKLFGKTTVPVVNGQAVFSNLRVDDRGAALKLTASAGGFTASSSTEFQVNDPSWKVGPYGPFGGSVNYVAFDRHNPHVAFAGGPVSLFRTEQAGTPECCTWQYVGAFGSGGAPFVMSSTEDLIYEVSFYSGAGYLSVSKDKGKTFSYLENAPADITTISFDRASSQNLWAGTDAGLVARSTDGGTSFSDWSTGLPTTSGKVSSVVVLSGTNATVFALFQNDSSIYRRVVGDASWTLFRTGIPALQYPIDMFWDRYDPAVVWVSGAKFYHWRLGDAQWTEAFFSMPANVDLSYELGQEAAANHFYLRTTTGIDQTNNNGNPWLEGNPPIEGIRSFDVDPSDDNNLLAGSFYGIGDSSGTDIQYALNMFDSWSVTVDPLSPSTLYTGSHGSVGIRKSVNGGSTWFVPDATQTAGWQPIVFDPHDSTLMYAPSYSNGVFKSSDGGAHWIKIWDQNAYSVAIDAQNSAVLYAATGAPGGVYRSTDSGGTWELKNNGLGTEYPNEVIADPSQSGVAYVRTVNGLFKTTNSGLNWAPINNGLTNKLVIVLTPDPNNPAVVYAGTAGGVFKTVDRGDSGWTPIVAGLPLSNVGQYIDGLEVDSFHSNKLYALVRDNGVYRSTDSGATWTEFGTNNATTKAAKNLKLNPGNPGCLYLGTDHEGVVRTDVDP